MRASIGIVMGVLVGAAMIYMPILIQQAEVPNPTLTGTGEEQDRTATTAGGVEEDVFQGERLPILFAIIGLGAGVAYVTYLLARGRRQG